MGAAFSLRMRQTTSVDPMPALSPATLRQNIEAMIERLLVMLDTLDGDPDLEPSLGWGTELAAPSYSTSGPLAVDLEDEAEDEPWLGSLDGAEDQRRWSDGTRRELEIESDEEDEQYAPS